jgi:hypothetical protein
LIKAHPRWNDLPDEKTPTLRIVRTINRTTYEQYFPRRGRHAMLAIFVEGLPPDAKREEVRVEVGGFGINPVYVGPPGGTTRTDQFQINIPFPPGLDLGPAVVHLWHKNRRSNQVTIELCEGRQW